MLCTKTSPWRRSVRHSRKALLSLACFLSVSALAHAQQRQWISLDGSPPGTRTELKLDTNASTPSQSFFDVFVHGFYVSDKTGSDGQVYQVIDVPDMPGLNQLGAPDLPVLRDHLGIVTGAQRLDVLQASVLDLRTFTNMNVWPQPYEAEDHPGWSQERFTKDQTVYNMTVPFPTIQVAPGDDMMVVLPPARGVMFDIRPFRAIPASKTLQVGARMRVGFGHTGTPTTGREITKDRGALLGETFANWAEIAPYLPINIIKYDGDFLFVYESQYADEIKPLVDQKKARGFLVREEVIPTTGNTCTSIRDLIEAWYASTPSERDHYAILVGDASVIPTCTSPTGDPTDDMYGDADNDGVDDLWEEVFLGRLSVDGEADLANQVDKILDYEDHMPMCTTWLDDVLLIAHEEDAPLKYQGCQEEVRTYAYSQVVPNFSTIYGSVAGNDNADITASINAGKNIVCYRGHGSNTEWWQWNGAQSFNTGDIAGLANGSKTPVVWSIACDNGVLSASDGFGETFMEQVGKGAVAHYGATVPSGTSANHELDKRLFRAVYDLGFTTHSLAIWCAEHWTDVFHGPDNPWMYLLLGDPEMKIRRANTGCFLPDPWIVEKPPFIPVGCEVVDCCPGCPGPPIDIRVLDPLSGAPVPGVKVAYIKTTTAGASAPGSLGTEIDEAQDNRYTQADGWAHVPAPKLTEGYVVYTVTDDNGNAYTDSIPVQGSTAIGDGRPATAMRVFASPSVMSTWTHIAFSRALDADTDINVYDISGRTVRALSAKSGEQGLVWDGMDASGVRAAAGVYLVKAATREGVVSTRVIVQ